MVMFDQIEAGAEMRPLGPQDRGADAGPRQADALASRPPHQRSGFITGRALVAALLARLAPDVPAAVDSTCVVCGAPHGAPRPIHAPVHVSVAHAHGLVIAAAVPFSDAGAIGIDIEATDTRETPDEPRTDLVALFAPSPPPTLRGWTRIEAALKADGRGLRVAPDTVRIEGDSARVDGRRFGLSDVPDLPRGYVATLALGAPSRDAG